MSDHDALARRAARWLETTRKCALVAVEPVSYKTSQIPDAIGWQAGGYVECWYLTPPGLVTPDDLPDGWGLLEEHGGRMRRMHVAVPRTAEAGAIAVAEAPLLVAIARRGVAGAGRVWTDSWRAAWGTDNAVPGRALDVGAGSGGVP